MTTDQKVARRKLSMPQLAGELNNVFKAWRIMGYCRQQFHVPRFRGRTQVRLKSLASAGSATPAT